MSIATTDIASPATLRPAQGAALAAWVRRWLEQRRQAAALRLVEPRLCEDADLRLDPAVVGQTVIRLPVLRFV